MKFSYQYLILFFIVMISACKKEFLDAKPNTSMVAPSTLSDYQALLENVDVINRATPALLQMASDDYAFVNFAAWQGTFLNDERNSYIWAKDLYEGQKDVRDWNVGYQSIFICNNVLEGLETIKPTSLNQKQWNNIKGYAYFMRAYAMYDLVRTFSPAYDSQTSSTDLGLPIRLKPAVDYTKPRASVEETYNQIFSDLAAANNLVNPTIEVNNKERPSKVAVMALSARIYLSMRKYAQAENYADSTLKLYNSLIDYNKVDTLQTAQFTINDTETILNTTVVSNYYNILLTVDYNDAVTIDPILYSLYAVNDLRKSVYFARNSQTGNLYMRFGYAGSVGTPFTGLATDEIYLIQAECLARRSDATNALISLNTLLKNRYKTGTFTPLTANDPIDALDKILLERRKELVWRSLRWSDLKRLNKEGANITLKRRIINGTIFTLPANDPRYVFPIPDEEIALSGIQQNIR